MEAPVTRVTAGAKSADGLSEQDYRDIFDELRSKCTLRRFADLIHSAVSFAWWGKYENYEAVLNRERRAELRAAVGLPALPATVAEAVADVDPDATVYRVGAGRPDRVVLVGSDVAGPLTMRLNGTLERVGEPADGDPAEDAPVTPVTRARTRASRGSIVVDRVLWERLNARRLARGVSWPEFLDALAGDLSQMEDDDIDERD